MQPNSPSDFCAADALWLNRIASKLVSDPGQIDDLVQDTWILAQREADRGQAVGRGWLLGTLRRRLWNRRRAEAHRQARERGYARSDEAPSTLELVERAELQEWIARELKQLPDPLRKTALMCFLEGQTPQEIARALGAPANTVRARLRKAAAQLRRKAERGSRSQTHAVALASMAKALDSQAVGALAAFVSWPAAWATAGLAAAGLAAATSGVLALRRPAEADRLPMVAVEVGGTAQAPKVPDATPRPQDQVPAPTAGVKPTRQPPAVRPQGPSLLVVDSSGQPLADYPVALWTGGVPPEDGKEVSRWKAGPTDARGRIALDPSSPLLQVKDHWGRRAQTFFVSKAILARSPAYTPCIELSANTEIQLEVPATAAVVVRLVDAEGKPWKQRALAQIIATQVNLRHGEFFEDGEIRWPHVQAGEPYTLILSGLGEYESEEQDHPALQPDEGTRVHTVTIARRAPVLVARLIDEEGEPIVDTKGMLLGSLQSAYIQTDSEGHTRIPLASIKNGSANQPIVVQLISNGLRTRSSERMLPPQLGPVDIEIGDWEIPLRKVYAEGMLLAPMGEGMGFMWVDILYRDPGRPWTRSSSQVMTSEQGHLRLMTPLPGKHSEWAFDLPRATGFHGAALVLPVPVSFTPGARGLLLQTVATDQLKGSLRWERSERMPRLQARIRQQGAPDLRVNIGPTFQLRDVRPGLLDLAIVEQYSDRALAEIKLSLIHI